MPLVHCSLGFQQPIKQLHEILIKTKAPLSCTCLVFSIPLLAFGVTDSACVSRYVTRLANATHSRFYSPSLSIYRSFLCRFAAILTPQANQDVVVVMRASGPCFLLFSRSQSRLHLRLHLTKLGHITRLERSSGNNMLTEYVSHLVFRRASADCR